MKISHSEQYLWKPTMQMCWHKWRFSTSKYMIYNVCQRCVSAHDINRVYTWLNRELVFQLELFIDIIFVCSVPFTLTCIQFAFCRKWEMCWNMAIIQQMHCCIYIYIHIHTLICIILSVKMPTLSWAIIKSSRCQSRYSSLHLGQTWLVLHVMSRK